eukprot:12414597-Karenia_brevis.AAC.1
MNNEKGKREGKEKETEKEQPEINNFDAWNSLDSSGEQDKALNFEVLKLRGCAHNVLRLRGGALVTSDEGGDFTSTSNSRDEVVSASDRLLHTKFRIILINARSFTNDDRLEELLLELTDVHWDAVVVNETWREAREEFAEVHDGHVWFGSGGTAGKHGVGILLHERWSNHVRSWRATNTRLGYLDINFNKLKLRLVAVYFPHAGYPDQAVQDVYDELDSILREGATKRFMIAVAGDWNAEVPSSVDQGRFDPVGAYANPVGNER